MQIFVKIYINIVKICIKIKGVVKNDNCVETVTQIQESIRIKINLIISKTCNAISIHLNLESEIIIKYTQEQIDVCDVIINELTVSVNNCEVVQVLNKAFDDCNEDNDNVSVIDFYICMYINYEFF